MVAVVVALALLALAIALAVMIAAQPGNPPSSAPPPSTPPGPATTSTAPSPTPSSSPLATGTETPEAGQTPVQPPVTVPPVTGPPITGPDQPETTAPPPPAPFPPSLRGQDLTVIPGAGPVVALTFDAGANSAGLPKILSALAAKGVTGTFFLTGNWAATNPGGVGQIVAAGHRVANHSMTHPGFTSLSDELIGQQVRGAEQAISAAGADPRPFFRFPYGERDPRTIAAVNDLGYVAVRWTVDTLGWKGTSGGISTQTVTDRVLAGLQPGEIVLMHIGSNPDDSSTLDADALPQMIAGISAAGYGFVTLDELLGS